MELTSLILESYSELTTWQKIWFLSPSFYLFLSLFLSIGVSRIPTTTKKLSSQVSNNSRHTNEQDAIQSSSFTTKVSIVVSARNEEQDLPACIDALLDLKYPKELLQIILVNDRSTDATAHIVNEAAKLHNHINAYHSVDFAENGLEAKARGLSIGMQHATGEWIFITDADGRVQPEWITHMLSGDLSKVGMIGGVLAIRAKGLLGRIERAVWAYVQLFNVGMSGWGLPFISVGPNMAIRRSIYLDAGGLEAADFTVAEDLALFSMVEKSTYSVVTQKSPQTTVLLEPVPSYAHLFSQQRRWFRGGIDHDARYILGLYGIFWYGFLFVVLLWFGWIVSPLLFGFVWVCKFLVEAIHYLIFRTQIYKKPLVRYLPLMQVYHLFILTALPLSFLFERKISWRGDGYSIEYD